MHLQSFLTSKMKLFEIRLGNQAKSDWIVYRSKFTKIIVLEKSTKSKIKVKTS